MVSTAQGSLAQARSPEEREAKIYDNLQRGQEEHKSKIAKTTQQFKDTRVTSCSGVLMKNGKAVCVAFNQGAPRPVDV